MFQEKGQSLEPAGSLVGNRLSNLEKENQQLKEGTEIARDRSNYITLLRV